MQFIRGLINLTPMPTGSVACIGNFDGVHLGHKALLAQLCASARKHGVPSVLILFEPQPLEFFNAKTTPARLTRLREKLMIIQEYPIDYILCIRFNAAIAALTPEAFIETILLAQLNTRELIIGADFQFGAGRRGDLALLQDYATRFKFNIKTAEFILHQQTRISSTRIRTALEQGKLTDVAACLGRQFSLSGHVMHGDKRARLWGIPTANIALRRTAVPISGVYAVTVEGIGGQAYQGVANVGKRPTVDGSRHLLEIHIFNYAGNLYGKILTVYFHKKIREEKRFENLDLLKAAILNDIQQTQFYFKEIIHE